MQPIVTLHSICKTFRHRPALFNLVGRERGGETHALRDVSLSAESGRVLVLLGPNGSGKTTLLKLISTVLLPDRGEVLVGGYDTCRDTPAVRRQVGFAVANERSFFARLTARENLDFFGSLEDVPRHERPLRIKEVLRTTGLEDTADQQVMKFSSGMYQKLAIARALLKHPAALLMDEPSRSLDPGSTERLWGDVRAMVRSATAVIVATHDFEEAAALGDDVALLHGGVLVAHKHVRGIPAADLRNFYFRHVENSAALTVGSPQ